MSVESLHGRALTRTLDDLGTFLVRGGVSGDGLAELPALVKGGLAWQISGGSGLVATGDLVALMDRLPDPAETRAAVFALEPELRNAWLPALLARLKEIGVRGDLVALCEAIDKTRSLAGELAAVTHPTLAATPYVDLERVVLPSPAHEAPAYPVLLRALVATAANASVDVPPVRPLPDVQSDNPSITWVPGRLLRLPEVAEGAESTPSAVLSGALDERSGADGMPWVLDHPWLFLLAQFVFTKEAWEAERIAGAVAYELEPANIAVYQSPPRIDVVVTLSDGAEVRCGSFGELTLRTLSHLGVMVLGHRVTPNRLDRELGAVVSALLGGDVWRFEHGTLGRRPGYVIHPAFSDACYRALGSRAFNRLGSNVSGAIRRAAETWARERRARAAAIDATIGAP